MEDRLSGKRQANSDGTQPNRYSPGSAQAVTDRLANSCTTSRRQKSANPEADAFRDDDARACIRSYLIAGGKGKIVFPQWTSLLGYFVADRTAAGRLK
jgi:hypothetical protein